MASPDSNGMTLMKSVVAKESPTIDAVLPIKIQVKCSDVTKSLTQLNTIRGLH